MQSWRIWFLVIVLVLLIFGASQDALARFLWQRYRQPDLEKTEADFRPFTLWAPKEWAGYNDLA